MGMTECAEILVRKSYSEATRTCDGEATRGTSLPSLLAPLGAPPPILGTHVPRSVSVVCWTDECSPWSTAFPPHPPPTVSHCCSGASLVLRRCPTPQRRACGPFGL